METIEGGGNTVRGAVLLLVNVVPVVVRPATATRYAVGADTTIVVGTMNWTRLVVPLTRATADAFEFPAGVEPLAGVSVTTTSAGAIVPAGKPVPISETVW
jgi:membrane protein YdbS with pleckstrin-like domain